MEFHADEISAQVNGSNSLATALLRLDLAEQAFDKVLSYYDKKIPDCIKAQNIYPQQQFVINFIAKENRVPFQVDLPQISLEYFNRYNKSKLVIKNQWASHPSTTDRVQKLYQLNIKKDNFEVKSASSIFNNINELQLKLTDHIFSFIKYSNQAILDVSDQFSTEFLEEFKFNSFNTLFNNYYDNKNPLHTETDTTIAVENFDAVTGIEDLFSDNIVDDIYTSIALKDDLNILNQIRNGTIKIKSFDYDGTKYEPDDCSLLILQRERELIKKNEEILNNDIKIFNYFLWLANKQGKENEFKHYSHAFCDVFKEYEQKIEHYHRMVELTSFMHETTPFETIITNMKMVIDAECEFKKQIEHMMASDFYQPELTKDIKESLNKYLSETLIYFTRPRYDDEALQIMYTSINYFENILSKSFFRIKKQLLNYMVELEAGVD